MITKDELESVGFFSDNGYEFYDSNGPDSMYDIREQTLYEHCEVHGVLEKLAVITKLEDLIELYYAIFKENLENYE